MCTSGSVGAVGGNPHGDPARARSSYSEGLSLASFRETSELEYGRDDGFILAPADDDKCDGKSSSRVILKHLKSRHDETRDIALSFDR